MEYATYPCEREIVRPPESLSWPGVVSVQQDSRSGTETITYRDGRKQVRAFPVKETRVLSPGRVMHVPATSRVLAARKTYKQAHAEIARAEARLDPASRVAVLEARFPEAKARPVVGWDGRDREGWDPVIMLTDYDREQLAAQRRARTQAQKAEVINIKTRLRNCRKARWIA